MIYLLYGEDTYRSRENLNKIIEKFNEKNPPHNFLSTNLEDFEPNLFLELPKSLSMFQGKYLIVSENVLSSKDTSQVVFDNLESMKISENIFVFLEEELKDEIIDKIKPHASKITKFSFLSKSQLKKWILAEAEKINYKITDDILNTLINKSDGNLWELKNQLEMISLGADVQHRKVNASSDNSMFDLTDAFAQRQKKNAIMIYEKYKNAGIPVEEIFWRIFWQAKTLLTIKKLSDETPNVIEKKTGLHPFVIKKTLSASSKFNLSELELILKRLPEVFQQSRLGLIDLDANMMRLFLRL